MFVFFFKIQDAVSILCLRQDEVYLAFGILQMLEK